MATATSEPRAARRWTGDDLDRMIDAGIVREGTNAFLWDGVGTALEKCGGRRGSRKVRHLNGASATVTAIGGQWDPLSASLHRRPRGVPRYATVD